MSDTLKQYVLLVDDRPENLLSLEAILEEPGRELLKAHSGEEALKILLKHEISLILLDVQMPGMDGFETAELIRCSNKTKYIPIIFVTAISKEQKNIFKGYESGAVDYLFKPVEPEIIKSKVKIFLELDHKRKLLELKNHELNAARKNTDNILKNVKDGFFLLDADYCIKPQYSLALESILMQSNLGNINFLQFLENKIPGKLKSTIEEYLELMFQHDLDQNAFSELNPMAEFEISFPGVNNDLPNTKILSFAFNRICTEEKHVSELIVTAADITDRVKLAEKLKDSENQVKKQVEWMFSILHIDPSLLMEFMETAHNELAFINDLLSQCEEEWNYSEMLKKIYRALHKIKGNAGLLDLKIFETKAHQFESKISDLLNQKNIEKADLFTLKLNLEENQNVLNDLSEMIDKINSFHNHFRPKRSYENKLFLQSLQKLITNIASELNKEVKFVAKDFDANAIPYQFRQSVKEIIIQLARNAIYHGIETSEERKQTGKNKFGVIELSSFSDDKNFGFSFSDNGRGLQIDKLRQKAKESGNWIESEIDEWNDDILMEIIHLSGLTTVDNANKYAGRGVGMDVVKDILERYKGKIKVKSKENEFCQFDLIFPLNNKSTPIEIEETGLLEIGGN